MHLMWMVGVVKGHETGFVIAPDNSCCRHFTTPSPTGQDWRRRAGERGLGAKCSCGKSDIILRAEEGCALAQWTENETEGEEILTRDGERRRTGFGMRQEKS